MSTSTGEDWTMDDVEEVVQATLRNEIPPLGLMGRLGPKPPPGYLRALGARFEQLRIEASRQAVETTNERA
jgi:hypothetical protein